MKKLTRPEIEFIEFDENDVIVTSGGLIPFNGTAETTPTSDTAAEQTDWIDLKWINEQTSSST